MIFKKHIQINVFLFLIVLMLNTFSGQSAENKEEAQALFQSKKYEEALPLWGQMLAENPGDSVCYCTGVCLVETNRFGNDARDLLLNASKGNVPADVNFFIAKNFHATNFFEQALSYYNMFKDNAGKKEQKELELKEKISMCNSRINPFHANTQMVLKPGTNEVISFKIKEPAEKTEEATDSTLHSSTGTIADEPVIVDSIIDFNLMADVHYIRFYQFRTNEGKQFFEKGWKKTEEMKKLTSETDSLRAEYSKTYLSEKRNSISGLVIDLENQIISTKSAIDNNYMKAREAETTYWNKASDIEKWQLNAENDSLKALAEKKNIIEEILSPVAVADSIPADTLQTDSITVEQPELPTNEPKKTGKVVFKIQIGKSNTELPESTKKLFKKIAVLRKIDQMVDERNFTVYTIGELTNFQDAVKLQEQIRQESVKDAFVIAIKDGKRIPLKEAMEATKK